MKDIHGDAAHGVSDLASQPRHMGTSHDSYLPNDSRPNAAGVFIIAVLANGAVGAYNFCADGDFRPDVSIDNAAP